MATQSNLSWGGVNICTPSDGYSGYGLRDQGFAAHTGFEYSIPNSAGRFKRVLGVSQTERTSPFYIFEGISQASSLANIASMLASLETAKSDVNSPHKTLSYSLGNAGGTYSETFCDCEFSPSKVWLDAYGRWYIEWTARFTKWGS